MKQRVMVELINERNGEVTISMYREGAALDGWYRIDSRMYEWVEMDKPTADLLHMATRWADDAVLDMGVTRAFPDDAAS